MSVIHSGQHALLVSALAGSTVHAAIQESIEIARRLFVVVVLVFNGTFVVIRGEDTEDEVYERWRDDRK